MTTFTISSDTNIDACAGGTGGHVYNISSAATLTIDQDSRAGLNGTTSNSIERIVTASTGGTTLIDGRYVRLIPFVDGSGTIEAGATVDCGDATGKVIAIYTSKTAAPALTGASGWIKVKQWNSVAYPTTGTFTKGGFTFTISGADIVGWIEVVAEEGTTAEPGVAYTGAYIGGFEMRGEWFELGTTSGESNQTFQIPTNGQLCFIPGIYIEQTSGAADFEFYANVADATDIATDVRAKVCWIPNTGLARIGNNGSTAAGYTPAANLRVVVGNIIATHCTAGSRTANVIPNATLANRFQIGLTYGGLANYLIQKSNVNWWFYADNPVTVTLTDSSFSDALTISGPQTLALNNIGVGLSANINASVTIIGALSGGSLLRCRFWCAAGGQGKTLLVCSGLSNVTIRDSWFAYARAVTNVQCNSINILRCNSVSVEDVTIIGGQLQIDGSGGTTIAGEHYASTIYGTTLTTGTSTAINVLNSSVDTIIDTIDFMGLDNVHPYNALVNLSNNVNGCRIRNIGTFSSPLNLGTVNACSYAVNCTIAKQYLLNIDAQRVFTVNQREGFLQDRLENFGSVVWGSGPGYAIALRPSGSESDWRAILCSGAPGSVHPGIHFWDSHISNTTSRLHLAMGNPTAKTLPFVTLTGGYWSGDSELYLKAVNDTCTWEDRVYRIGHTGFSGAPVMAGGTASNYLIEYAIDFNDGVGWRDFETASAVNLEARNASIDAARGFKLKVRITTTSANTSAITSLYFGTTSTTTTQAYQYKMYETPVTFHAIDSNTLGNVAGAWVYVEAGTGGEYTAGAELGRGQTDANGLCTIIVKHDASQLINGVIRKSSAAPFYDQGVLQAVVAPGESQTIVTAMTRQD